MVADDEGGTAAMTLGRRWEDLDQGDKHDWDEDDRVQRQKRYDARKRSTARRVLEGIEYAKNRGAVTLEEIALELNKSNFAPPFGYVWDAKRIESQERRARLDMAELDQEAGAGSAPSSL
jgi:hypothetical protein